MASSVPRVTLIGAPFDAASSHLRGPAAAPPVIRAALASPASNLWTESGVDLGAPGVLGDAGDLPLDDDGPAARAAIERGVGQIVDAGSRALLLGGDHSVSYPALRAMRARHPALTVLHIDAHPDLYPEFEGDRYSHACPFARVLEDGLADRLIQVGIRTMNGVQRAQAERHGVTVIDMDAWTGAVPLSATTPVYVSLDVDALDPAFAPGVSHPEPGGLSVRDVLRLLRRIPAPVVGADLVELNPARDPAGLTAIVCAKLLKELVGVMVA